HVLVSVKRPSGDLGLRFVDVRAATASAVTGPPKSGVTAPAGKNNPCSYSVCSSPGISTLVAHTRRQVASSPPAPQSRPRCAIKWGPRGTTVDGVGTPTDSTAGSSQSANSSARL